MLHLVYTYVCMSSSTLDICCVQVTVEPGSSVEVSVLFKPSALGAEEHTAEVSFTSGQVCTGLVT